MADQAQQHDLPAITRTMRNNVSDNFEACYLSENGARRAFKNENVNEILKSSDFQKCVKYMSHLIFSRNDVVLLAHGFTYDDILSIVHTWGLQFFNYEQLGKTKHDTYYLMMHFISQKTDTFFLFMNRKFRINESYIDLHLSDVVVRSEWHVKAINSMDIPGIVPMSEEDEQATIKETYKERKAKLDTMRKALNGDIAKHSDRLSELATAKIIDFQVRKKARQLCKKHNIDYVAWAKKQIETRKLSETDFVLV
jgi:hypothetical protein